MSDTTQHILETATDLFQQHGYVQTTLSHIAEVANIPITQLETHYCAKEYLVLDLYRTLAEHTLNTIATLPDGHIAQRYFKAMEARIQQLQPHYDAMAALLAMAMIPQSGITTSDITPGKRDPMYQAFMQLVQASEDSPAGEDDVHNLAMLLYTFHFMILVFWVYDRTKAKQATHLLIDFMGDFFKVMRPMMLMPLFSKAMTKLAQIMMLVFGGARLVEADPETPDDLDT